MAGDWIKVEASTPNKPEVLKLARLMGITRDDAFGKAMRFWLWLDGISVDGRVDGVASHDVDAVVGAEGVARALADVGWLIIDDDQQTIAVPHFDRHNGVSAKARATKGNRQRRWRDGRVDGRVDGEASTKPSLEKRREEKSKRELKFSSSDTEVANKIWQNVREAFPNSRPPAMGDWANTIRLLVERDGRTHEQILDLFTWASRNAFWAANIRSPGKLREKWDQLEAIRTAKPEPKRQMTLAERNQQALEAWKQNRKTKST
jgi:hypothetical protein